MMAEQQVQGEYENPYKFNAKELDSETELYYYGARYYNPRLSVWYGVDPLAEKMPSWSPYNYTFNNPIRFSDPDGMAPKDIIILIWATHDGKIGHAGVAISNYKPVTERVKISGKWVSQTRMVEDGTYTYRDLWPGSTVGKSNYNKNVPASYTNKKVTMNQLLKTDVTGSEGYVADGIIKINTDYANDSGLMKDLDLFEKNNISYNGVKCNCSDFVEEALVWTTSKSQNVDEQLSSTVKATTPNKIYKAAKSLPNSKVLRDPGKKVDPGFVEAVAGGQADKARKKMD